MRASQSLEFLLPAALGAGAFFVIWNPFEKVDHAAWERDLDVLLADLSRGYANLDWLAASGRIRPPALAEETRRALREASSNRAARDAVYTFIDRFGDPHLRIAGRQWLPGFLRGRRRLDIDYRDGDYETLPPGTLDAGLLKLGEGRSAGVIRIKRFGHESYKDVMTSVQNNDRAAMRLLLKRLERRIVQLADRGAGVLLIDILGNGGGSDWADGAARLLTPKPLRYGGAGFVRHPHYANSVGGSACAVGARPCESAAPA